MTDLYPSLFEQNPRPMWLFDRETLAFVLVNDAACRHYGWTRKEFLAMTLADIRAPEDVAAMQRALEHARVENRMPTAARHRTKSGATIDVELEIARFEYEGRPASLVVVDDVTGVREAERLHRLMVERSAEGISVVDPDGTLRYLSPGAERLLGRSAAELVGKPAVLVAHPDDVARLVPPVPGTATDYLTRARHSDGSWRWIESTITNLTLDPGVRAIVSNFRDVTRRIEAERALKEAHRRLEFLLSATPAIMYSARVVPGFEATFISPNLRAVLGWTPEEFRARSFWVDHLHADDRPAVDAGIERLFATGAQSFEYRFAHRDGGYRWVHDEARLVRDDAGAPSEVVGYMIDISEQPFREHDLRHAIEQVRVAAPA